MMFGEGPSVSSQWAFSEHRGASEVQNRRDATKVLEHCLARDQSEGHGHWKWYRVEEFLRSWWDEGGAPDLKARGRNVLQDIPGSAK